MSDLTTSCWSAFVPSFIRKHTWLFIIHGNKSISISKYSRYGYNVILTKSPCKADNEVYFIVKYMMSKSTTLDPFSMKSNKISFEFHRINLTKEQDCYERWKLIVVISLKTYTMQIRKMGKHWTLDTKGGIMCLGGVSTLCWLVTPAASLISTASKRFNPWLNWVV
jgi:hypothetical protein